MSTEDAMTSRQFGGWKQVTTFNSKQLQQQWNVQLYLLKSPVLDEVLGALDVNPPLTN